MSVNCQHDILRQCKISFWNAELFPLWYLELHIGCLETIVFTNAKCHEVMIVDKFQEDKLPWIKQRLYFHWSEGKMWQQSSSNEHHLLVVTAFEKFAVQMGSTYHQSVAICCIPFNATVHVTSTLLPRVWWQTSHLHPSGRTNPESMHSQFHTALATSVTPTHSKQHDVNL